MVLNLNNDWKMRKEGDSVSFSCDVPCSVYKTLTENGVLENPYYRENELVSTAVCDDDYTFSKEIDFDYELFEKKNIVLHFDGIDTLGEVYLNGRLIGETDNMHCEWEFDVKDVIKAGKNLLEVKILSPNRYIAKKQSERYLWGVDSTMDGYTHLRKAHYMFGWDWGPKLPDMGLWRDVKLFAYDEGRITDLYYQQKHTDGRVELRCKLNCDNHGCDGAVLEIYSPQGEKIAQETVSLEGNKATLSCVIENPQLWWANGYGEQPLYKAVVRLVCGENEVDERQTSIGLRTLTVSQDADEWGNEFCFKLNGKKIFAMGANYIPEDQIITRATREKTEKLLESCVEANYNFIRVWGGGCYPDDWFFDYCDRKGLIVWQDFMFACSSYLLTEEFERAVVKEVRDNIIRIRNHASLGLWCGNNEIESAWEGWGLPEDEEAKADYLVLFEKIIPGLLNELDPDTFYWPSSPSSGGGFNNSSSNHAGDMHYWAVWHSLQPIEDFRKYHYRFCSEYGFESLPSIKTCNAFADREKGDFNLTSPVMENHQKCTQGNEKIMFYLAQMVRYPYTFEELIYSSQLVQADSIRSNVEHMRRSRGRCMGSAYWQVNDSNPVISWSSIDYFGRLKPLHYCAKRFYAPVLLSVDDSDAKHPVFNVSNETFDEVSFKIRWNLRTNGSEILQSGEFSGKTPELSSADVLTVDISEYIASELDKRSRYLEYTLEIGGKIVSGASTLFVRPKLFSFLEPEVRADISETDSEFVIEISARNYTKSVWLDLETDDALFSDNWFDVHGGESVSVSVQKSKLSRPLSLEEFKNQLVVRAYNTF